MGWQTDWLYKIVFKEYRKAWKKAQKEGLGQYGPASTKLILSEYSDADLEESRCRGEKVRLWIFDGSDLKPASKQEIDNLVSDETTGMFYKTASAAFHITEDRKKVVIEYWFGPRYGRGFQYGVKGQGKSGRFVPLENVRFWFS